MSFNVLSLAGLTISGKFIPFDLQEKIADDVITQKNKERFNTTLCQLKTELMSSFSLVLGANCGKKTKYDEIVNYFYRYDKETMKDILKHYMNCIYWHSTTHLHKWSRYEILKSPHTTILMFSYQDLIALRYFITVTTTDYDKPNIFTNTWYIPVLGLDGIIFPWGNN